MADESKWPKVSFEKRVEAQLAPSTTIDWAGADFDSEGETEWIQPRLLGFTSSPARRNERQELWTAQFNCFVDVGFDEFGSQRETTHRVWELVDLVRGAFDQFDLDVQDFGSSGDPVLYQMRFDEPQVTPVPGGGGRTPSRPNLQQLNVSYQPSIITDQ